VLLVRRRRDERDKVDSTTCHQSQMAVGDFQSVGTLYVL
jgi:hypothetical protein